MIINNLTYQMYLFIWQIKTFSFIAGTYSHCGGLTVEPTNIRTKFQNFCGWTKRPNLEKMYCEVPEKNCQNDSSKLGIIITSFVKRSRLNSLLSRLYHLWWFYHSFICQTLQSFVGKTTLTGQEIRTVVVIW